MSKEKPCPICRRLAVEAHRPFCSKRCSNVDLGRWLGERYAIPAEEAAELSIDDEETPPRMH